MILKTEQAIIVYAQWNRWAPYNVIKHHTPMLYQNSSKGNEEFPLIKTGLARATSRFCVIFSLKSLFSVVKLEKFIAVT